jgi:hypothetical protein
MRLTPALFVACAVAFWLGLVLALVAAGRPGPCGADNQLPASMGGGCALSDEQALPGGRP